MDQYNTAPSAAQEKIDSISDATFQGKHEGLLLDKVRLRFGFYGCISLLFGAFFTFWFYKAAIGLNVFLFTSIIIILLCIVMKELTHKIKTGTKFYFLGSILLSISTVLTASENLQFLNILGILFLLDLSLLHQFYESKNWDFTKCFTRMFGLVFQSIGVIWMPFVDSINLLKRTRMLKNDKVRNIFIGVIISVPILLIITALLSGADLLFGKITNRLFQILFSTDLLNVGIMILFGFLACYCILCGTLVKMGGEESKERAKADASIAVTICTLLSLIYLLFCGIQLVYLFANGLFNLPEEFTFAEYARRGFFELLTVTIINIVLILFCRALFKESKLLRVFITIMTVCTYIMIASATYRMLLYIGAYHLTFLRLFVLLSLLIDALVLAGVLISEYNKKFPLFRYSVAVITICYLAFSFSKPDYFIASYLVEQKDILDADDIIFMTNELSKDAAPVVLPLLADEKRWTAGYLTDDNDNYDIYVSSESYDIQFYYDRINHRTKTQDFRDFNLSYYIASKYANRYPMKY